jgi:hypothetical protein
MMPSDLTLEIALWVILLVSAPSLLWLGWRTYRTETSRNPISKPMTPPAQFAIGSAALVIAGAISVYVAWPNPDPTARLQLLLVSGLLAYIGCVRVAIGIVKLRRDTAT